MSTTELVRAVGWRVPFATDQAATLGDLFDPFVDELLEAMGDDEAPLRVVDS